MRCKNTLLLAANFLRSLFAWSFEHFQIPFSRDCFNFSCAIYRRHLKFIFSLKWNVQHDRNERNLNDASNVWKFSKNYTFKMLIESFTQREKRKFLVTAIMFNSQEISNFTPLVHMSLSMNKLIVFFLTPRLMRIINVRVCSFHSICMFENWEHLQYVFPMQPIEPNFCCLFLPLLADWKSDYCRYLKSISQCTKIKECEHFNCA